jgi:hypothetical protein
VVDGHCDSIIDAKDDGWRLAWAPTRIRRRLGSRIRRWLSEGIIDRLSLGDKLGAEESLSDRLVGWVRRWVQRRQFAGVVTQIDRKKDLVSVCCCFFASLILFCSTSYVEVFRRARWQLSFYSHFYWKCRMRIIMCSFVLSWSNTVSSFYQGQAINLSNFNRTALPLTHRYLTARCSSHRLSSQLSSQ